MPIDGGITRIRCPPEVVIKGSVKIWVMCLTMHNDHVSSYSWREEPLHKCKNPLKNIKWPPMLGEKITNLRPLQSHWEIFDRSFTLLHRCCCLCHHFGVSVVLCLTFLLPFYQVVSTLSAHQHCNKCIWYTFVFLSLHFHVQCIFFSFICVLLILLINVFGWRYYEKIKNWMQCLRFFQFFFEHSISLYFETMVLKIPWYQLQHLEQ
jgi:hypothetical protein